MGRNKRKSAYIPKATYFGKKVEAPKPRSRKKRKFFQNPEMNHLVVAKNLPELLGNEDAGDHAQGDTTGWSKMNHRGQLPPGATPDLAENTDKLTDEELLAKATADAENWEQSKKRRK